MSREPVLASAVGFLLMGVILFVIFDKASDLPRAGDVGAIDRAQLARQTEPAPEVAAPDVAAPDVAAPDVAAPDVAAPHVTVVPRVEGSTQQLGAYLFRNQLVNLELAGLILTVAMVGAIVIARKRVIVAPADEFGMPSRATPEVMIAPATPIDDDPHSIPVYGTLNPRQKEYPET